MKFSNLKLPLFWLQKAMTTGDGGVRPANEVRSFQKI